MEEVDARQALDAVIRKSGETYASISRLLGRNPTYVQQYIKRGIPRRLDDTDLRRIARRLEIPPADIGAHADTPHPLVSHTTDVVRSSDYLRLESIGPDTHGPALAFHAGWVAGLASNRVESLALLRVEGDSMLPALAPGDQLLIDRDDADARLRDGLYVLRIDGAVIVKRLAVNPSSRKITILSDNDSYPMWDSCDASLLDVVGRVVWTGRRFL